MILLFVPALFLLLYGYGLSFEPYNFKGRPGDMPETVRYGTAVDALRAELAPWLWNGALVEDADVTVTADAGDGDVRSAVWRDERGRLCAVVANYAESACTVSVQGLGDSLALYRPGEAAVVG